MVELSLDEFMRAFAFARAVKNERPREDFYVQLIGRLGEMIFRHEARRALPQSEISDLNWFAMPKHVAGTGVDLRIQGWKVDVMTPSTVMVLDWPSCKRADLFPRIRLDKTCLEELAARYRKPTRSKPIGLLDDPIVRVAGAFVGWIGIGSAERLAEDEDVVSRLDDALASPDSLWTLLGATAGPAIRQADDAWQRGCVANPPKRSRSRQIVTPHELVLLPPRRALRDAPGPKA